MKTISFLFLMFGLSIVVFAQSGEQPIATRSNEQKIAEFNQDISLEYASTYARRGVRNDPTITSERFYLYNFNQRHSGSRPFPRGQRVRFERFQGYDFRFAIWGPILATYYGHWLQPLDSNNNPYGPRFFIFTRVENTNRDISIPFLTLLEDEVSKAINPDFNVSAGTRVKVWRENALAFNDAYEVVTVPASAIGTVLDKDIVDSGPVRNTSHYTRHVYLRLRVRLDSGQTVLFLNSAACIKSAGDCDLQLRQASTWTYPDLIVVK